MFPFTRTTVLPRGVLLPKAADDLLCNGSEVKLSCKLQASDKTMCLRRQSSARGTSILCSQRDLSNQLLSIFLSKQLLAMLLCSILFFPVAPVAARASAPSGTPPPSPSVLLTSRVYTIHYTVQPHVTAGSSSACLSLCTAYGNFQSNALLDVG